MAKVFVFGNSYNTRTLLSQLGNILNEKIEKVVLLNENHNLKKDFKLCPYRIELFYTIKQCINEANLIIVLQSEKMPVNSINEIIKICDQESKRLIIIPNLLYRKEDSNFLIDIIKDENFDGPIILNIALGDYVQHVCGELKINSILSKNNISFKQIFSLKSKELLQHFLKSDLLIKELKKQLCQEISSYDVMIISLDLDHDINNLKKYQSCFQKILPDCIILQTDMGFCNMEYVQSVIQQCSGDKIDINIYSRYKKVDVEHIVYCTCAPYTYNHEENVDIESDNLSQFLKLKIFSCIAMPEGVIRL